MQKRIATGITALDEVLEGGVPSGSTILVVGSPGAGKTILAHQMMFSNASPDNKAIYFSTLAEPQVKVLKFQKEFSFFDMGKFQNSVFYYDLGSILGRHGPTQALSMIDKLLKEEQPGFVVIDTLKTIADMFISITEFRQFLLELSLRLSTWGCTSLMLCEYAEEEIAIRPESAIADGIILLSGMEEKKQQKRFLRVLKMRGTSYPGGQHIFRISHNGIEVFPRLNPKVSQQEYKPSADRISIGSATLDEMMSGGIPLGSTTLVCGETGTGKTLLALKFAFAGLKAGETVTYVSFEESPELLIKGALTVGLDLQPYISNGKLIVIYCSPMELDVDEHIFRVQQIVKNSGTQRLIIDSITAFEIGMQEKAKYTDYIWALCDFFKTVGVSVLMTNEATEQKKLHAFTKHGISFVADNLLLLYYDEEHLDIKRYLRIIKMRFTNHVSSLIQFTIGSKGITFTECLKEKEV